MAFSGEKNEPFFQLLGNAFTTLKSFVFEIYKCIFLTLPFYSYKEVSLRTSPMLLLVVNSLIGLAHVFISRYFYFSLSF